MHLKGKNFDLFCRLNEYSNVGCSLFSVDKKIKFVSCYKDSQQNEKNEFFILFFEFSVK